MRQYQVPQFIDIEDKIIGPLTLRQFMYLAGAGGIIVICFYLLPLIFFLLFAVPVAFLALAMAFLKINGVPFPRILTSMLTYATKPHLYIWKQLPPAPKKEKGPEPVSLGKVPTLTESKLQDLAWSLDIKEKLEE